MNMEDKLAEVMKKEPFLSQLRTLIQKKLKEEGWKEDDAEKGGELLIKFLKSNSAVKSGVNNIDAGVRE